MVFPPLPTRTDSDAAARRAGFTIMELMIVLVIVGIMAMTVAPSLSEILSGSRHASAAMDLVRFVRRARSQSIATSKAQLIRFQSAGSKKLGRIDVYSGMNNRCRQTPWTDNSAVLIPLASRARAFDMTDYNPSAVGVLPGLDDPDRPVIALTARTQPVVEANVLAEVWICYQPDGMVYAATFVSPPTTAPTLRVQDMGVELRLRREIENVQHGKDRLVVLPTGGNARLQ